MTMSTEQYKPYTYLIKVKSTGQVYYGARYANGRNNVAHPSDLWDSYFTSSRTIKKLITEYGVDGFDYSVRRIFTTKEQALRWEQRVLKRFNAKANPKWINQTNGHKDFHDTEESRQRKSLSHTGKKRPPMTEEQKAKISATRLARQIKHSDETKAKMSLKKQGANNNMYGRHHTTDTKLKLSKIATGRPSSLKGKPKSEEQKAKQSATMKAKHQDNG